MTEPFAEQVGPMVERIRPILAYQNPQLQSAVLADLLALWLAGFVVRGDVKETRDLRAELLRRHLDLVRQLTEVNARMLGTHEESK